MSSPAHYGYRGSRASYVVVIAALLVLLPVLAVLQYRWIGQLSEDERQRLSQTLTTATNHVAQDVTLEAVRLYLTFQIQEKPAAENTASAAGFAGPIADRYAQWNGTSTHPQVVKRIFLVNAPGNDELLFQFDPETGELTSSEWPPELAELKRKLSDPSSRDIRTWRPPGLAEGDRSNEDLHVIVPVRPQQPPSDPPVRVHAWTVVVLDSDYIIKEWLPALVQKYFPPSGEYRVVVFNETNPPQVLYRSDPSLTPDQFKSPDAKVELFGLEAARLAMLGRATAGLGALQPGIGRGRQPFRFAESPSRVRWQMVVQHYSGSLDTVVNVLRRRNLVISFGILLILTIAVAMIIVLSERARSLARLQMELAASVSHELKTPLAVIRTAAYNLESGIVDSKEDIRRYAGMLRDAGRRLSETVDEVLTFAETQAQRKKYELRSVDVRDVVDQTLERIKGTRTDAADIATHLPDDLPMVKAEPTALTHCLQNLITNALKYTKSENGGSPLVTVSATKTKDEIQLHVTDTGTGIDREDLRHLFQPFFRGKNAEGIPGSGLGLNLVQRMMEAQGGRVTVKTEEHRGSSFTLHIPIAANGSM